MLLIVGACKPIENEGFKGKSNVSMISFNLRYDEPEDNENQWSNRKEACVKMIRTEMPSVLGIQEGLYNQVSYLNDELTNYDFVGVGRDDGHSGGEYAAIFYDSTLFEVVEYNNFWLSETSDYPSIGWDANNIRICTWARLRDKLLGKEFYVFNTHLDHKGKKAQEESSKLIMRKINEIVNQKDPVFLMGDFNMLIGNSKLEPIISKLYSAQRFAKVSDDNYSYNAFGVSIISRNIDFIFYRNAEALAYKTLVGDYGVEYISDHYPIISHFNY